MRVAMVCSGSGLFLLAFLAAAAGPAWAAPSAGTGGETGGDNPPEVQSATTDAADDAAIGHLVEALRLAYQTSPTLSAQRLRTKAESYAVPQAKATFGPTLTYEGRYGYENDKIQNFGMQTFSTLSGWSSAALAVLTQPLATFGRNASNLAAARARRDYSEQVLKSTEAQLFADVVSSYASVIRDRNAVAISEEYLGVVRRELSDNAQRFVKREATSSDVQQAATRVELAREQVLGARQQAAASEAAFIAQVGQRPGPLAAPNPIIVPFTSLDEALAAAELRNPVLLAANAREQVSRAQASAARADFLPRVDLRGTAGYSSQSPYSDSLRQRGLTGQVVLSGTLFDSGLRSGKLHEADANNEADARLIEATLRDVRRQVAEAWNTWITQAAAAGRLELAEDYARRALDGAVIQEKSGLRTALEVLDLARDYLIARNSRNAAQAAAYVAQARILALSGQADIPEFAEVAPVSSDRGGGGGVFPVSPVLMGVDGLFVSHRKPPETEKATVRVAPAPADPRLDTTNEPVVP